MASLLPTSADRTWGVVEKIPFAHTTMRFYQGDIVEVVYAMDRGMIGTRYVVAGQEESGRMYCKREPQAPYTKLYWHQVKLVDRPVWNRIKALWP